MCERDTYVILLCTASVGTATDAVPLTNKKCVSMPGFLQQLG